MFAVTACMRLMVIVWLLTVCAGVSWRTSTVSSQRKQISPLQQKLQACVVMLAGNVKMFAVDGLTAAGYIARLLAICADVIC